MHAFDQVVVPYQIQLAGEGVVVAHEHHGLHVAVKRVVLAVEKNLRHAMAGAVAEYAIAHAGFVKQVRYAQRAVSAGVETEDVDRLRNVALRSVVAIAFVVAVGYVEVEYRQGLLSVGRKPPHNRVCHRLLGEEVDGADFQPRVYHLCRADVLHA